MTTITSDVIDDLTDIAPGSALDQIRGARPETRLNAQKSFLALFEPEQPGGVGLRERYAVAAFVAGLHGDKIIAAFYAAGLAAHDEDLAKVIADLVQTGVTTGPYGSYPPGPLTTEAVAGPIWKPDERQRTQLGARLAAVLEHAHLLVFHPRDASVAALQVLLAAGWTATDIVTVSQLVAFLAFQIRTIAGLRVLAGTVAAPPENRAVAGVQTTRSDR
jgi:CMD domain protein